MPEIPLRITHIGERGRARVRILRADEFAGEPASLQTERELAPGDSELFRLRTRTVLVVVVDDPRDDAGAGLGGIDLREASKRFARAGG